MKLTGSLVLYNSNPEQFENSIRCFLEGSHEGVLVVSDNSERPTESKLFLDSRVIYIHNGRNLGFGAGHNRAFAKVADHSEFHLFLNPDVAFGGAVLDYLIAQIAAEPAIGAIMPQVRYADGQLQRLCKQLPTPIDLILRRFLPASWLAAQQNAYELAGLSQSTPTVVPTLSGCFLLVRSKLFSQVNGFDERYFMYMEDFDLVRRIGQLALTVYDPRVSITHHYQKGSYRSRRLLGYHVRSAIAYFNKWGWIVDHDRAARNRRIREEIAAQRGPALGPSDA